MNISSHSGIFFVSAMNSPSTSPAPSFDENVDIESSPKRSRVVSVCRNCSMTFRVNCRSIGEFCSKDCHTNYTIFGGQSCCRTPDKSAAEIRTAIYQFQNKLDNEFEHKIDQEPVATIAPAFEITPPITPPVTKKAHHNIFASIFQSSSRNGSGTHRTVITANLF